MSLWTAGPSGRQLCAGADARSPPGETRIGTLARRTARRARFEELDCWIADHLAADLSIEALAARMNMSPIHFSRTYTRIMGRPVSSLVRELRIAKAKELLLAEAGLELVGSVGYRVGLTEVGLRRLFKLATGIPPDDWLEEQVRLKLKERG